MTTPAQYRQWATMYRENGEDATADICEIQAQEAERLETLRQQFAARMDELDEVYERDTRPCLEGKPSVKIVMTKDGPQALLQGFDPPPIVKGNATQTTMF